MKNNKFIAILAIVCVILLCGVGYTILNGKNKDETRDVPASSTDNEEKSSDTIVVDGREYRLNTNIQTVLFMGIDKNAKSDMGDRTGENGQSDSLNLLIVDRETKKAQILQISRDSMVDIDI